MKKVLLLAILTVAAAFSANASAASCKVDVVNGRGMTLDTFTGIGYDRIDACREARMDCRQSIRAGYYRGRVLNCVERVRRGPRGPVSRSCTVYMRGPRGHRVLDVFTAVAGPRRSACQRAKVQQHRPRAICTIESRGGVRRPGRVRPPRRPLPPVCRPGRRGCLPRPVVRPIVRGGRI